MYDERWEWDGINIRIQFITKGIPSNLYSVQWYHLFLQCYTIVGACKAHYFKTIIYFKTGRQGNPEQDTDLGRNERTT